MNDRVRHDVDVAVIGAGPAGLAAAVALRRAGVQRVEVIEREPVAGGIPRHSAHTGYGLRDFRRIMTGPAYARRYAALAAAAGVNVRTTTMVTGLSGDGGLEVTSPAGLSVVHASAVLMATGARERPRPARWVPGDRGQGVYTTGQLQQTVYLHDRPVGRRAVVVGAEHVAYSAMMTLRHAGVEVAALVTELSRPQSYLPFHLGARWLFRVPVLTGSRVVAVRGKPRPSEVELERLADGHRWTEPCDTVVFTGDWVPDHELARTAGVGMDPHTLGPATDATGATTTPGLFAAGNLCHPVETADVAALSGRHAGRSIARWLAARTTSVAAAGIPIEVDGPLAWSSPQRISSPSDLPARGRVILRPSVFAHLPRVRVTQADRVLWEGRLPQFVPSRPALLPASWLARVDPSGAAVRIEALI
ncbi:FAD-dependent oxidoreductase [Amycolatopsis sp. NPDC004368]